MSLIAFPIAIAARSAAGWSRLNSLSSTGSDEPARSPMTSCMSFADQFDSDGRCLLLGRGTYSIHHFVHRWAPPAWLEKNGEIAAIGRRGRETELAARPASERFHRRIGQQDSLEHAHLPVGLREGRARRRPVIEDESTLVHLRQKAGAD